MNLIFEQLASGRILVPEALLRVADKAHTYYSDLEAILRKSAIEFDAMMDRLVHLEELNEALRKELREVKGALS